jgi:hypothetical protein
MTVSAYSQRAPGLSTLRTASHRQVMLGNEQYLPGLFLIKGANSRDPGNSPVTELRAGLLMGRVTSGEMLAPSVLGVTSEALDGSETALDMPAAVVTELLRRQGASGTFKLTGPPTASGTVRTMTVTYSGAADTDTVTITALGVAEVQTLTLAAGTDGGNFAVKYKGDDGVEAQTASQAWNVSAADLQTALRALHADLAGVTVGLAAEVYTVTFPRDAVGAGTHALFEIVNDTTNDGTVDEGGVVVARTATGIDGRFVTGSLVQPTDGSETPVTLLPNGFPIRIVDEDGASVDAQLGHYLNGGLVDSSQIINWPADASLKQWIVDRLIAVSPNFVFDHKHNA